MTKKRRVVMSPPDYFTIKYAINPWMNIANPVNPGLAQQQWHKLKSLYQELGLTVLEIPPVQDLPDLVFTTDHGVMIGKTFYLSHFRYPERQREQKVVKDWYTKQGMSLASLPPDHYLEGGDLVVHDQTLFLGHGFRTSENAASWLAQATGYTVIPLTLTNNHFYHLDTCFLPLNAATALYYPHAFDQSSRQLLKSKFSSLIPITLAEANNFACNSVIMGKHILCQPNKQFEARLTTLGYTPIPVNISEFNKSGGGLHCLSQILD